MKSVIAGNVRALRDHLQLGQAAFGERVGSDQPNVSKWERGTEPSAGPLAAMAELAGVSAHEFRTVPWTPSAAHIGNTPDRMPTLKSEEGSIPLRHIDMSLAMGEGRTIEDYYEEGAFEFDASLLRQLSRSPPHRLVVGHGIGDSMVPTIHDDAMVIFDTTQTVLNTDDKIWAISLFGAGSIKRLQVIGRGRVLVVSDNPIVPNKEVSTEDLRILGRVIWSARRH